MLRIGTLLQCPETTSAIPYLVTVWFHSGYWTKHQNVLLLSLTIKRRWISRGSAEDYRIMSHINSSSIS